MDISEHRGSNLSLVLLDWKMVFDKVNQTKLLQALRRLKVPPRMLTAIEHIYSSPRLRVATGGHNSSYRIQRSGIRLCYSYVNPFPWYQTKTHNTKTERTPKYCMRMTHLFLVTILITEGSLEVKLPTIWTDGKSRDGKSQRGEEKRKSKKKEDAGARKDRKVAIHCVFTMICGSLRRVER